MNISSSGTVYNLIILDESFSMEMVREPTVQGFNELVQSVQELAREFPRKKQMVSLILSHIDDPAPRRHGAKPK